ncbi:unnamed protein product [Rotaria sordida]|uniref:Uncharacterized protein n=1 Tax=Rotaria sordida TaxID=392033 RepID=A0A815JPS1_9BILA|nr:unnamed protein product [Rotaria sordida]CAF1617908.1 unnamed protein product [Rotaria sordida]
MPREYLITMLLPAIGHFVNGSQIRTNTGTPTNISFFTTIIGYPSVNKSSATEAVLNACLAIEKHLGIKTDESRINCSATVESLLTELKNTWPRLIQIWDEAVTLLQSFGLYKQGGAAYDRSIMCTLYNSSAVVKRQTKSGNITVENPVLNIAAAAHPADIFSSVSNESDDDGLMARFLFSAPQPCIPLSNEIRSLNIDEPSLTHLLYIIFCFNSTEQNDGRRNDDEDQRPVHETLDEMRQRLAQKRDEQERIDKNQAILAESRRSKTSTRSEDGNEQRYPEKVILLARGTKIPWINISLNHGGFKAATLHQAAANLQTEKLGFLRKEKTTGAQRATTYFSKVPIDPKWNAEQLTTFSNKLANFNVSLMAYQASFTHEASVSTTETEDEESMDASPSRDDVPTAMSPPPLPPRDSIHTTASSYASHGFELPPPTTRVQSQQRTETPGSQFFLPSDKTTTEQFIKPHTLQLF